MRSQLWMAGMTMTRLKSPGLNERPDFPDSTPYIGNTKNRASHPPTLPDADIFPHFPGALPAASTPSATCLVPLSIPVVTSAKTCPTGRPAFPVVLAIVSPMPRPPAPMTPPTVRAAPPTPLPRVEVAKATPFWMPELSLPSVILTCLLVSFLWSFLVLAI